MVILKTVAHETIWGGQKLRLYTDGKETRIGHLYSLCCEPGLETKILNGEYKDRPFHSYFLDNKERFGLGAYEEFPLIIALVEANDNLSIQVHPDDRVAAEEENAPYGKNESWFFMDAPQQGAIFNGCQAGHDEVLQKIQEDDLMSVVGKLPVSAGDYVYVEAGTLHALAKGSFLYEIEENSPWTYRMYDFGRTDSQGNKRELHVEKAMKALKPRLKSVAYRMGADWVEERRYALKKLEYADKYINESHTLECITMLKGSFNAEQVEVGIGMTAVLEPGDLVEGNLELAMVARPK